MKAVHVDKSLVNIYYKIKMLVMAKECNEKDCCSSFDFLDHVLVLIQMGGFETEQELD